MKWFVTFKSSQVLYLLVAVRGWNFGSCWHLSNPASSNLWVKDFCKKILYPDLYNQNARWEFMKWNGVSFQFYWSVLSFQSCLIHFVGDWHMVWHVLLNRTHWLKIQLLDPVSCSSFYRRGRMLRAVLTRTAALLSPGNLMNLFLSLFQPGWLHCVHGNLLGYFFSEVMKKSQDFGLKFKNILVCGYFGKGHSKLIHYFRSPICVFWKIEIKIEETLAHWSIKYSSPINYVINQGDFQNYSLIVYGWIDWWYLF